jgi:hypothetical protein
VVRDMGGLYAALAKLNPVVTAGKRKE